jgi:hypothetical protein
MRRVLLLLILIMFVTSSWPPVFADTLGYWGDDWASGSFSLENIQRSSIYPAPVSGTADSMFVWLYVDEAATVSCALYDYSDTSLLDTTVPRTLSGEDPNGWYGFGFVGEQSLAGADTLMLLAWADGSLRLRRIDSVGVSRTYYNATFGGWPATLYGFNLLEDMAYGMFLSYQTDELPSPVLPPRRRRNAP